MFFQLHVTNAAGHVATVNTSSVRLPAHYPPSHAVVMDVLRTTDAAGTTTSPATPLTTSEASSSDPTTEEWPSTSRPSVPPATSPDGSTDRVAGTSPDGSTDRVAGTSLDGSTDRVAGTSLAAQFSKDVDVIAQREEVCVAWSGFYHQEEVAIEVAVGTAPGQDDVIRFQPAKKQSHACLNTTSVPVYTKLFSVVKATSSGGTAVFSSDGFVMIPTADAENQIKVFNGRGCHDNDAIGNQAIAPSTASLYLSQSARIPIHAGDFLFVQLSPFVPHLTFHNAILLQTTLTGYQLVATTPNVTATLPVSMTTNTTLRTLHCLTDSTVLRTPEDHATVGWEMLGPWTPFVKYLKVAVVDKACLESAAKKAKYSYQQCLLQEERAAVGGTGEARVPANDIVNGRVYVSSVSPCLDDGCLPPASSAPVTYSSTRTLPLAFRHAAIRHASPQGLLVDVQASAGPGTGPTQRHQTPACVYQWTVARDRSGSIPLADWAVRESPSCANIEVGLTLQKFQTRERKKIKTEMTARALKSVHFLTSCVFCSGA